MISERHSAACRENIKRATEVLKARYAARRLTLHCENCGGEFKVAPSKAKQRFCGNPCRYQFMRGQHGANAGGGDWMRGPRNPNWKGGVPVDVRTRQPHNAELAQWRRQVFARDRYTCQRCGVSPKTRRQLRAHHIAPWATNPDCRFDVANGVTLCRDCHTWVHSPENADRDFLA